MAIKIYDGSGTNEITFVAAGSTDNVLQVSNYLAFGEYRDGDNLVVPSSNGSDRLTVVGAYADATRLDYIEYYDADDALIAKRLVTEIGTIPNSNYHFFAGTSQNDVIDGGQADSISATGYSGDDQITGSKGSDYLGGNEGDDALDGDSGDDFILGGSGNDYLTAGDGNDRLFGGDGNDDLHDDWGGNDHFDGGDGFDRLFTLDQGATSGAIIDVEAGTITSRFFPPVWSETPEQDEVDTFTSIEGFGGTDQDDVFIGSEVDEAFYGNGGNDNGFGGGGDDVLIGGDGDDILEGGDGNDTLSGGSGNDQLDGGAGDDTLDGGDGDNFINGGAGDDVIKAGDGKDTVDAGAGNDIVYASPGADHEDGGEGVDTFIVEAELDYVPMFDLELETVYLLGGAPGNQNSIRNFENVTIISNGSFGIKGDANANVLTADKGNDTLSGGAGNDTLNGGAGNDTLDGAAGDDILRGGGGDDLLLTGSGDDILFGEAGNDTLRISGTGFSTLDGGDGSDTLLLDMTNYTPTIDDFVTDINLVTGIAGALGVQSELADQLISIENIDYRGPIASQLTGNDEDNVISGGDGNDTLNGGAGNDQLDGGAGDDQLDGGAGDDILDGGDGDDVISAGDGSDLILAGAGDDTITVGGSQTFSSFHQAVNTSSTTQVGTGDKVTLEGMLRIEDVIDGGADTDTIELGEGNVALFLHDALSGFHSSVQLSSDSTGEQSKARLENIEQITGSDGNNIIDLTSPDYSLAEQSIEVDGGLGADIIWGSDANETIKGGDGDDELFGGAGTNILTGGAGADEFQFTMTSENDSVTDFNAAEGDTLKFFNTGGATFNRDSVTANSEGDGISIEYSHNNQTLSLNISLGLSSISEADELLSAIEII